YEITPPDHLTPIYYHAVDYMGMKRASVNVANYEPVLGYFPIALQPGKEAGNLDVAEAANVKPSEEAARTPYLFTWKMPDFVRQRLTPWYAYAGGSDGGAVFRSRVLSDGQRSTPARPE